MDVPALEDGGLCLDRTDYVCFSYTGLPVPAGRRGSISLAHISMFDAAHFVGDELRSFRAGMRTQRVTQAVDADEIVRRLAAYAFVAPMPLEHALADVAEMLRRWTLHATHPRYFGLFVPGVHEAGIWADALTALYNPQVGAWWHAPAANEIERHTLAFLATVLGIDARAAHFTSGASEGNLTALLAAITAAFPDAPLRGVGEAAVRGKVYLSSESHHSLHKAVRVAGLGEQAITVIPCTSCHTFDVNALRSAVVRDVEAGYRPIMVVGTVGTTTAGAIDDLRAISKLAHEQAAWFHVDAAWGGAAAFVPSLRAQLAGIEHADSVTWDAHKSLSVPMGAGMFFCRRADVLASLFNVETSYVPPASDDGEDLYLTSLQWSRRCIGLKVFLTLATLGRDGVTARIEHQMAMADYLRHRLRELGWRIVNRTDLPLVCFTHASLASTAAVEILTARVVGRGQAWVSCAALPQGRVIRACVTHDDTTPNDVDVLCDELMEALNGLTGAPRRGCP